MPSLVYKFGPDMYVEWTTVSEGPTSMLMNRDEMIEFLFDKYASRDPDYYDLDMAKTIERLDRADKWNSSAQSDVGHVQTPDDLAMMWRIENQQREDMDCPTCYGDDADGPCPIEGHAPPVQVLIDEMKAERAEYDRKQAIWIEERQPELDRLIAIFKSGAWERHEDKVVGWMYRLGIMDTRDLDHLEHREWTLPGLMRGEFETEYDKEVKRLFATWNKRMGAEVFTGDTDAR